MRRMAGSVRSDKSDPHEKPGAVTGVLHAFELARLGVLLSSLLQPYALIDFLPVNWYFILRLNAQADLYENIVYLEGPPTSSVTY